MDHPVKEIPRVIHALTEGSPAEQKQALLTYYSPSASFTHPFCRVSSFPNAKYPLVGEINSRWVIWMIFRWYKILSPKIVLDVHSVVYDQKQQLLYVNISQVFHLFFLPRFVYDAHVSLVTVLRLAHDLDSNKYFIESQEDLYQVNEFVKFFFPWGTGLVWLWQWIATLMCVMGGLALAPFTWVEEKVAERKKVQ